MFFKSLLVVLIGYWIYKRVFRVVDAVKQDGKPKQTKNSTTRQQRKTSSDHTNKGEYVDYEEVE